MVGAHRKELPARSCLAEGFSGQARRSTRELSPDQSIFADLALAHGHTIAVKLGELANQIRRRAEHAPSDVDVLAPFEPLLAYQSGPALKAAATKEKARAKQTAPGDTLT